MSGSGLIHVYCGDGKGKTTAALGLCVRAAGTGMKVALVQFLKNSPTGELAPLQAMGVTILRGKSGAAFTFSMTREQEDKTREIHNENLQAAIKLAQSGAVDLLVLDEAIGACNMKLLDTALLRDFVEHKPPAPELVLTGRNPPEWMLDAADYVTEMKKIKHPYDKGITARKGIEG